MPAHILRRTLERLPFRGRVLYVFSYDLEEALLRLPARPLPAGITIGEADEGGLADAAGISVKPGDADLFARRRAAGRRCFVARQGARAIGYRWMSALGVEEGLERTVPLRLKETEGYVYDVYVVPAWRGSAVNRALSRTAFDALIAAGCVSALGVVRASNTASLAAVSRYGTLVAAVEQRRRPLRWAIERVRPVPREEAEALAAAFREARTPRVAPGWLARRGRPLLA